MLHLSTTVVLLALTHVKYAATATTRHAVPPTMLFAAAGNAVDHLIDKAAHSNANADALAHAANAAAQAAAQASENGRQPKMRNSHRFWSGDHKRA